MKYEEEIYSKVIKKYGFEHQLIVAIEELSELQKELTKALRGKIRIDKLHEEIADVEIMICQLKMIYSMSEIEIKKSEKLARLEELENGK